MGIGAGSGILSSIFSGSTAKKAANEQVVAGNNAIDKENSIFNLQQQNQNPFIDAGKSSIAQLMQGISDGKFGSNAPNAGFQAPTAEQARATPGYQFNLAEGDRAIERGQSAAGGAFTGGTLKALQGRSTDLADSTYQQTYQNALSGYQANLSNYQTNLQNQQQQFGQLLAPSQLGEVAAANLNSNGTNNANSIADLMTQIGNARSAGVTGSRNALQGIFSSVGNLGQSVAAAFPKALGGGGSQAWQTNGIG